MNRARAAGAAARACPPERGVGVTGLSPSWYANVLERVARALGACVCVFAAAAPAFGACDGAALSSTRSTLTVDGTARSFIVRVPATYDGRTPAPVVFGFHPFGMNGDYMASRVPVSRSWREAIAIYPTGAPRPGSGGAPAWQNAAGEMGDRDLHFFDAMLAWIRERACVDAQRVFVFGYSNGAGLAYLLACERPSAIAGLAIASGRLGCRPATSKRVIISHGSLDTTIPYDQAIRAAAEWATVNGCTAPPAPVPNGCALATSCASAPVTLCTYPGGHEYNSPFTAAATEFLAR